MNHELLIEFKQVKETQEKMTEVRREKEKVRERITELQNRLKTKSQ